MGGCLGGAAPPYFNGTAEAMVGAWDGFKLCLDNNHIGRV